MAYRDGNYTAFYVMEPFSESNLGAQATPDFVYYNLLKGWKARESDFAFIDSHDKTYNVRDGSDWERTLKPRLHERLNNSKNIILFLSKSTANSRALEEELRYGIYVKKLPVIVVYPDYSEKSDIVDSSGEFKNHIKNLWIKLPSFYDNMKSVATLHIPLKKELVKSALRDADFMVNSMTAPGCYFYQL